MCKGPVSLCLITITAVCAFTNNAAAAVTNIAVSADTFIDSSSVDNNAGANTSVNAGSNGSAQPRRGLFRFDLAGIPPGSTVTSAVFQLAVIGTPGFGDVNSTYDIFPLTASWGEGSKSGNNGAAASSGEATWNSRLFGLTNWTAGGATGDYQTNSLGSAAIVAEGTYSWSSTLLVSRTQAWLDNPTTNNGVILITRSEGTGRTARKFGSREGSTPATLTIGYLPLQGQIQTPSNAIIFTGLVYSAIAVQYVSISNAGSGTLDYSLRPDVFWLNVSNLTGHLSVGQSTSHTVRVLTRGLARRTYHGNIEIQNLTDTNDFHLVPVSLGLQPPPLPTLVVSWGGFYSPSYDSPPAGLTNAIDIEASDTLALALRSDGTIIGWGDDANTGIIYPPFTVTDATDIALSPLSGDAMALRANGRLIAWGGYNDFGQTNVPPDLSNVVAMAVGGGHMMALRANGTVTAWGYNDMGQTNVPPSLSNIVAIAAGALHSMALSANGTISTWGYNQYGECTVPADVTNVVGISAGDQFSMALLANGTLRTWGHNHSGPTTTTNILTNAVSISQGAIALRDDGLVATVSGSLNQDVVTGVARAQEIAAGGFRSHAIVIPHQLLSHSDHASPQPTNGQLPLVDGSFQECTITPTNIINGTTQFLSSGWVGTGSVPYLGTSNSISFTITNDSTITWLWQTNYWLSVSATNGTVSTYSGWYPMDSTIILSATSLHSNQFAGWFGDTNGCTINGTEITVPMNSARSIEAHFGTPAISASSSPLIFTGQAHSTINSQWLVVSNAGPVPMTYTLASDRFWLGTSITNGDLAAGQSTTHVVRVDTRGLGVRIYGGHIQITSPTATNSPILTSVELHLLPPQLPTKVVAWGDNTYKQTNVPPTLSNAVLVAAGDDYSMVLRSDATIQAWGNNTSGQTNAPSGTAIAIATGWSHALALRSNGTITAWGSNGSGQTNIPTSLSNVVAISAGRHSSFALRDDGTVVAWGRNNEGQTNVPSTLTNLFAISAGRYYALALRCDGTVAAWGDNSYGQTNVPAGITNAVAVAAGGYHSLALKSDGTILAWGRSTEGQTTVPTGVTNVVAISAGLNYSMALLSDGKVRVWGDNSSKQTNVPNSLLSVANLCAGRQHSLLLEVLSTGTTNVIPEWWLSSHGLTNSASADGAADLDGDGMTTLEEYIADLDPTNAQSVLQVEASSSSPLPALYVDSSTGRIYSLQSRTSLVTGIWTTIPGQSNLPGNGSVLTLTNTNPPPANDYYRVRVAIP